MSFKKSKPFQISFHFSDHLSTTWMCKRKYVGKQIKNIDISMTELFIFFFFLLHVWYFVWKDTWGRNGNLRMRSNDSGCRAVSQAEIIWNNFHQGRSYLLGFFFGFFFLNIQTEAAWTPWLLFFHYAPLWREYLHPPSKLFLGTGRLLLGP